MTTESDHKFVGGKFDIGKMSTILQKNDNKRAEHLNIEKLAVPEIKEKYQQEVHSAFKRPVFPDKHLREVGPSG